MHSRAAFVLAWLLSALPTLAQPVLDYLDIGDEPVPIWRPSTYDPAEPLPLIIALHAYTTDAAAIEDYLNFLEVIEDDRFLYCTPNGPVDSQGDRYWNATDACCDVDGADLDHSGFLRSLIDLIRTTYSVDDRSIHLAGYSNGGFMSYRMACDHADLVASIMTIGGMTFLDPAACNPSEPVHVLALHGTRDSVIRFDGGCFLGCYPSAMDSAGFWAGYNGCAPTSEVVGDPIDIDAAVDGDETIRHLYSSGCDDDATVELWALQGSLHRPTLWLASEGEDPSDNRLTQRAVDWFYAHRKPQVDVCIADSDGDGVLSLLDFLEFQNWFALGDPRADLDGDGDLTLLDFLDFQSAFAIGCP
ncbi:MAG: GC-type dockerin domain-anchored protein [Planctomycetota bacterium]